MLTDGRRFAKKSFWIDTILVVLGLSDMSKPTVTYLLNTGASSPSDRRNFRNKNNNQRCQNILFNKTKMSNRFLQRFILSDSSCATLLHPSAQNRWTNHGRNFTNPSDFCVTPVIFVLWYFVVFSTLFVVLSNRLFLCCKQYYIVLSWIRHWKHTCTSETLRAHDKNHWVL